MPITTRTRRLLIGSGLALAGLVGAACGSDQAATTGGGGTNGTVEIGRAWARTSPSSVDTGAAYMTITGGAVDDRLLSADVPSAVAATAQIHEMVPVTGGADSTMAMGSDGSTDTSTHTSTDTSGADGGAIVMKQVAGGVEIPAGTTVALEPGGYHVMLMELASPLRAGATFDLTLSFENAGDRTVTVEVRTEAP